jgi:hypothetical protein
VGTESGEPPQGENFPRAPSSGAHERAAEARALSAEDLRDFASELADADAAARREQEARISSMVEERLASAERKLNASIDTRLESAVAALARDRRSMLADWADRAARAAEVEARVEITLTRLLEGVGRIDEWLVAILESERRILDAHSRVSSVERSVADWAKVAQQAADWEQRMFRAAAAEAEAAKRILDAERRLRDRL